MYTPSPIIDFAVGLIKKLDTVYYNVQAFLAQATIPVDYYVHQLLQVEPEAPTNDPRFLFARTLRLLLYEACTLLTLARLDNLYSGHNLPLMVPNLLSEHILTKNPANSGRKKPFRRLQQQAASQAIPKMVTIAATAPVTNQTNLADGSNQKFANYTGGFRAGRSWGRGGGGDATSRWSSPPIPRSLGVAYKRLLVARKNRQRVLATIEQTPATEPASQVEHETHGAQISKGHDVGDCGSAVEKGNREGIPAIIGIL
ncbi:hypothetical protein AYI69_g893 [Smittium culicis]|uniref:Uncharacterized protein n=1 Tax=Smittium culicis TaxID=133412 RepID=A0A1R1YRR6_9FUNG|nr:hypothetical protein AYI69_g893 [Smittium culicis]